MTASARLRRRAAQLVRYAATSVVATTTSMSILTVLVASGTMRPAPANVVATAAGIVPSFELNRRWVWGVSGKPSFRRQIAPFVGLTLAGMILSTVVVGMVGDIAEHSGWSHGVTAMFAVVANLAAWGAVWIVQFIVLDRLLFKPVVALTATPAGTGTADLRQMQPQG